MVEMNDWEMEQEQEDWEMTENWDDAPDLLKKSSSNFEAVYSTNKLNRGFKVLKKEEIMNKQEAFINEVSDETGISLTLSRALLLKYDWNKEKLMDAFASEFDLVSKILKFDLENADRNQQKSGLFLCGSCYEEYELHKVLTMPDCYH